MKLVRSTFLLLTLLALEVLAERTVLVAQTAAAQAPEASDTVIRSSVHEVLLDVVVRQKNMQLARKLTAGDFTVNEDGVPQTIKTFRFVAGGDSDTPPELISRAPAVASGSSAISPGASRKLEEPGFVSIVFDQLTPGTRKYAHDAVHSFLTRELRSSLYVSVFTLDVQTKVLQNFTNDRVLLTRAVDRAVLGSSSSLAQDNASVLNQTNYTAAGGPGGISVTANVNLATTPELATADAGTTLGEGAAAAAKIVADQRGEVMYQGGMHAVTALMNLVKYEASLPGRKTVVYLSEGLNLPPDRQELLDAVIEAAKRGGVTFYGIDVRGLSTSSTNALAKNLLRESAGRPRKAATLDQVSVANTDLNMDALATKTGGFAVFDTNEIARAMLRVMQDVRTRYEISYTPVSENFDGHFRKVQVSVNNPKLTVQSREGYFSLPDLDGKPVLPFEMAGLRALDTKPAPSAFPFRMEALRYRPGQQGYQYEIAFEVPTANITPHMDPDLHKARLRASFLALIKDAHGQVVEKVSRTMEESVVDDKLALFREGAMIFTTPVALPPGRYTVEGATVDEETSRASSKRAALVVGQAGAFSVSDISLVRDVKPIEGTRDQANPLDFPGGHITPELSATAKAGDGEQLFFVIYPGHANAKPKVTMEFLREGVKVGAAEPSLSGPDETNSIPVVASVKLPEGDYEAKVTVEQDGKATHRSFAFTVIP